MRSAMSRTIVIATAILASSAIAAWAATQGTPGSTSSGTVDVKADKLSAVRISGLNDIEFAASATTPAAQADPVCVFSNPGRYLVNVSSANASATSFRLKDSGTNYIGYRVTWYNAATGGTGTDLGSGTTSAAIAGADQTSPNCGGANTARIQVLLDDTSFLAAPAGVYSDTLTVIVTPP